MVSIWLEYRTTRDNANPDEHADIAIMDNQAQIATNNWQDYEDYDYNPWAPINAPCTEQSDAAITVQNVQITQEAQPGLRGSMPSSSHTGMSLSGEGLDETGQRLIDHTPPTSDGNQQVRIERQTNTTDECRDVTLKDRFAKYPWHSSHDGHDPDIKVVFHEGLDTPTIYKAKFIAVTENNGEVKHKQKTIPCSIWHPLAQWVNNQKWTRIATERGIRGSKLHHNATWMELTIVFQLQTGYNVISASLT